MFLQCVMSATVWTLSFKISPGSPGSAAGGARAHAKPHPPWCGNIVESQVRVLFYIYLI